MNFQSPYKIKYIHLKIKESIEYIHLQGKHLATYRRKKENNEYLNIYHVLLSQNNLRNTPNVPAEHGSELIIKRIAHFL